MDRSMMACREKKYIKSKIKLKSYQRYSRDLAKSRNFHEMGTFFQLKQKTERHIQIHEVQKGSSLFPRVKDKHGEVRPNHSF